ncbi:MAG: AzlC family ABC transporter permease, partial [Acidimicrobiia bacterium]|nr:AzlC family ABC transporter permease [Acidimicrobiia bacterium]
MPDPRSALRNRALSIGLSTVPFGLAFGVACAQAGLEWWEAAGFSTVVFGGSAQFAAVGVLADGGAVGAAIAAGALLNLRSVAFGLLLAPSLQGPLWW